MDQEPTRPRKVPDSVVPRVTTAVPPDPDFIVYVPDNALPCYYCDEDVVLDRRTPLPEFIRVWTEHARYCGAYETYRTGS